MKGISRIDSKHTHGWFVRISREGHIHSKMFSDGPHGGKQEALEAAIHYRDEYEREHPRRPEVSRIRQKLPSNNTTGVLGVSETYTTWKNGDTRACFLVSWSPEPRQVRQKTFYHHHFDCRKAALEAAAEFRRAREREMVEAARNGDASKPKEPTVEERMRAFLKSWPSIAEPLDR